MKILIFWSFFDPFLQWFYRRNPGFAQLSYAEQQRLILAQYFGNGPSYVNHARHRGQEATILVTDCLPMQKRWAEEHGLPFPEADWMHAIPLEQVKRFKPDVVFIGSMFNYYGAYLGRLSQHCRRIVAWMACPIPAGLNLQHISMVLSSNSDFVDDFRRRGLRSEVLPAAFDPDILSRLPDNASADVPFSFVGSISPAHAQRRRLVEKLVKTTPLELWGTGMAGRGWKHLARQIVKEHRLSNPLASRYRSDAYGLDMYGVLQRSKITFNSHIDVAGGLCGNMRMFEATGVGTLLLTDYGRNIRQLFEPGSEVVTYDCAEDAAEKVRYYLDHDEERRSIAQAGQRRALAAHSMADNMDRMLGYFRTALGSDA